MTLQVLAGIAAELIDLAQTATPTFDWSTYGPVGIIAGLGIAFFFTAYKREKERADRLESELREQNKLYREDIRAQLLRAIEKIGSERTL